MAFRFRIILAALLVLVGIGCRKPLAPSSDSNAAPETWITAAPQDTITIRNNQGLPTGPVTVGVIAFRFHLYWAGSDHDGDVRGFYWAVTETVKTPGIDIDPPVPAPRPSAYRYTSKTDSVFIFNVSEETRTRRHAFYLYAVDNEGKVDPTPARFVFDALDRFPPFAVFTHSYADGLYRDPRTPNAPPEFLRFALTDTFQRGRPPRDTVPSGSRLLFRWRGQETIAGNPAVSFKYKLDESTYIVAAPGVDSVVYGPERSGNSSQVFEVRAIDVAGASRADQPTTRFFVVNFNPDTWFAGPDPNVTGFYSDNWGTASNPFRDGQKLREIPNWASVPAFPGSLLGPDSLLVMPKDRIPRKTFFEVYRNRVFMRVENDTINLNSWVLFFGGGFDSDSPYRVRVDGFSFPPTVVTASPVLQKTGPNGSPIGQRLYLPVFLYPTGPLAPTPLSPIYPLDEAINVPEKHIAGYIGLRQSGRGYAVLRSVDGDGRLDDRIQNPVGLVDSLERGILSPGRIPLRDLVLTFYINRAPYLQTWAAAFLPKGPWNNQAPVPYVTRDVPLNWSLHQQDQDPFDSIHPVGGAPPNATVVPRFRYTLSVRGQTAAGTDTVYRPQTPTLYRADVPPGSINIPIFLQGPDVTLDCELCDYPTADFVPGQGRCRYYSFPIQVPVASTTAVTPLRARPNVKTGPGNPRNTDGGLN